MNLNGSQIGSTDIWVTKQDKRLLNSRVEIAWIYIDFPRIIPALRAAQSLMWIDFPSMGIHGKSILIDWNPRELNSGTNHACRNKQHRSRSPRIATHDQTLSVTAHDHWVTATPFSADRSHLLYWIPKLEQTMGFKKNSTFWEFRVHCQDMCLVLSSFRDQQSIEAFRRLRIPTRWITWEPVMCSTNHRHGDCRQGKFWWS